jgi:DnaK suppressor protein
MPAKATERGAVVAETAEETRYDEVRRMLIERRRELLDEVQHKIRTVRVDGCERDREVFEQGGFEGDIQEDIEIALIQMKAETLTRIDEALGHIQDGTYGRCFECGEEISPLRLRAIPFAVRCRVCEEAREMRRQSGRTLLRGGSSRTTHPFVTP